MTAAPQPPPSSQPSLSPESTEFPDVPGSADEVLAGLDPEQREVATALRGPVCVKKKKK